MKFPVLGPTNFFVLQFAISTFILRRQKEIFS